MSACSRGRPLYECSVHTEFDRDNTEESSRRVLVADPVFSIVEPEPNDAHGTIDVGDADNLPAIIGLCARLHELASGDVAVACDVEHIEGTAGDVVDALARLQLAARRSRGSIRLRGVRPPLRELLVIVGLETAIPMCDQLRDEVRREAEQREELCVEEAVDPDDPVR
jgi:hypothetical protein